MAFNHPSTPIICVPELSLDTEMRDDYSLMINVDPALQDNSTACNNFAWTQSIQRYLKAPEIFNIDPSLASCQYAQLQPLPLIPQPSPSLNDTRDFSPTPSYGRASLYSSSLSPHTESDFATDMYRSMSSQQLNQGCWSAESPSDYINMSEFHTHADNSMSTFPIKQEFSNSQYLAQDMIATLSAPITPCDDSCGGEEDAPYEYEDGDEILDDFDEEDEDIKMPIPSLSDEDDDYKPGRSMRLRRPTQSFTGSRANASRITKSKKKSGPRGSGTASTSRETSKAKAISSAPAHPFACVYAFAGCDSTFPNKNEWKRHVISQHLGLTAWECKLCQNPGNSSSRRSHSSKSALFNRKDLFTQHLRRMHTPVLGKNKTQNKRLEADIKHLQEECLVRRREPPQHTVCPLPKCSQIFNGPNAWDDRMEHVGKHHEQGDVVSGRNPQEDAAFVQWSLEQGIVETYSLGQGWAYKLSRPVNEKTRAKPSRGSNGGAGRC